jgi:hypothetical protein
MSLSSSICVSASLVQVLAKEIIHSRKAVGRLYVNKAQMISIGNALTEQLGEDQGRVRGVCSNRGCDQSMQRHQVKAAAAGSGVPFGTAQHSTAGTMWLVQEAANHSRSQQAWQKGSVGGPRCRAAGAYSVWCLFKAATLSRRACEGHRWRYSSSQAVWNACFDIH